MRKFFILLLLCAAFMNAGAQQNYVLNHWNPGSYYDLQNNKITGFVRWNVPWLVHACRVYPQWKSIKLGEVWRVAKYEEYSDEKLHVT